MPGGDVLPLTNESLNHRRDVGNGRFIYYHAQTQANIGILDIGSSMPLGRLENDVVSPYSFTFLLYRLGRRILSPVWNR